METYSHEHAGNNKTYEAYSVLTSHFNLLTVQLKWWPTFQQFLFSVKLKIQKITNQWNWRKYNMKRLDAITQVHQLHSVKFRQTKNKKKLSSMKYKSSEVG